MKDPLPPNPVGALRPREFLCMECKPLDAGGQQVHLLLLLDAYSFKCLGSEMLATIGPTDYVTMLEQVGQDHDLHDDVILLCDLPPEQLPALHKAFPYLIDVRHDPKGVAAITDEARRYMMARFAALPKN